MLTVRSATAPPTISTAIHDNTFFNAQTHINMKLEIILQLLYTNDLQDIVARAVQIENNISLPHAVGDRLLVQISKHDLPADKQFASKEHYGHVSLPIVAVNVYSINKPYLVNLPSGKSGWYAESSSSKDSISEIVDKIETTIQQLAR